MDSSKETLQRVWDNKRARRRLLTQAPIEKKVEILIRLQQLAAPALAARNIIKHPWHRTPKK